MFFPDLAQVHRGPTYDLCAPCRALSGGGTYKPYPQTPVAHILRAQYLLSSTFFNRRLKFTMAPFDIIETRNSSIDGPVFSLGDGAHRTAAVKVTLSSVSTPGGFSSPHEIYDGGYAHARERGVLVRIANGTAGQVGVAASLGRQLHTTHGK